MIRATNQPAATFFMCTFTPRFLVFVLTFGIGVSTVVLWNSHTDRLKIEAPEVDEEQQLGTFQAAEIAALHLHGGPTFDSEEALLSERAKRLRFGVVGVKADKEVTEFYLKFQKAVVENDSRTVASMISYPFQYYLPTDKTRIRYRIANNKSTFLKVYPRLFDERLKRFIGEIDAENPASIWAIYDGISVGRGTIWIGVFSHSNRPGDDTYRIAIRTIFGNGMTDLEQH